MSVLTDQQQMERLLRTRLRELCAVARREALWFALLTVLLTPAALVLSVVLLLGALMLVDLPLVDHLGYSVSCVSGVNLCLAFMAASCFLRGKVSCQRMTDGSVWLLAAAGLYGGILALSYATPLAQTHPLWFWPGYLLLALLMLGAMGHAYVPGDWYYLGWTAGPLLLDDPFTLRDDLDRAHVGLGCALAIPHLVLSSYGEVVASRWLWHGLHESEICISAQLLQGLNSGDLDAVTERLQVLSRGTAARCIRALLAMGVLVMDRGVPRIGAKGRELLEQTVGQSGGALDEGTTWR